MKVRFVATSIAKSWDSHGDSHGIPRQAGESLLVFDRDQAAVKGAEALGAKGGKSTAEAKNL